jgi:peptidoglycan/xylan/chitin deacetylase (PgdA/CDA1 family)
MVVSGLMGVHASRWTGLCLGLLLCISTQAASAADCPGHPDALGTSRTLVVDPLEHPRIGAMQYGETLPLADHEVVLTFDDGPLPAHSNRILEILAAQCIKATFFTIGRMATAYPDGVRKLRDAGHTIGTHTESHPLYMKKMPIERARAEIDDGIASVTNALGDSAPAPFFRIPGLSRAEEVEDYVASKGIQTWSADFLADDWRHVSSKRVFELAIKRLEARGRGILLLHDIQARTVAALPRILHEMKSRGYRIVHVVPATPERPATPTELRQWQLHSASETVAASHWPTVPNFVFTRADTLPAPALSDVDWQSPQTAMRGAPSRQASWPAHQPLPQNSAAIALPVPAPSVFEIRERRGTAAQESVPSPLHTERTVIMNPKTVGLTGAVSADASGTRHAIPGSLPIIPARLGAAPVGTR